MKISRWKLWMVVCCCGVSLFGGRVFAQQAEARPSLPGSIGDAAAQKERSARFLAQRGIGVAGRGPSRYANAAQMLSEARAGRSRMARQRASGLMLEDDAATASLSAPWQPVGPAQVMTSAYGAVTGRVTSIAVDPSDTTGNTVYVGTTGGGVWKSTKAAGAAAAATFAPLTDEVFDGAVSAGCTASTPTDAVSLSIGALSVQPGGTGVVLAGTGDPNDATDSYYGAGILRSTDHGLSWCPITATAPPPTGGGNSFTFFGTAFAGFAWSTATPNLVVAAVSQAAEGLEVNAGASTGVMGLYYSQDAGATWQLATIEDSTDGSQLVQSPQLTVGGRGNAATSVVWNPVRKMFYAAVRFHGYYQSADGITWVRLTNQPGANLTALACPSNTGSNGSPNCPIFRGALAVQPVTGDTFALTVDGNNLDQGLWQDVCALSGGQCSSNMNNTVTFTNQIADMPIEAGSLDPSEPTTIPQADYDLYLAAVPLQQDTLLFAGTEDIYTCSLANSCMWTNTTNSLTSAMAKVAPAQHAIDATLPMVTGGNSCLLFFGNDGGLWRSTNAAGQPASICTGSDGNNFDNLNGGLGSLAEVQNLAQDAGNAQNMMASLGALGTAAPQGSSTAWTQVLGAEGNNAAIDPTVPQNWYATSEFGVGINRCTQGAACNQAGFGQVVIGSTQVSGDLQTIPAPWILDPQNSANVILGTCRVWRGPGTGGAGWSPANLLSPSLDGDAGPFCNGNAEIRSLAASGSPTDAPGAPERIYAGMAGLLDGGSIVPGHVFTATVPGSSSLAWTDLSLNLNSFNPGGFDISSIYVDPHDPSGQTVYVTVQGFSGNGIVAPKVYSSMDGGQDWTNISQNLLNVPANSIVVDPNDQNTVYVATDAGVFVTTDVSSCTDPFGSCWNVFGTSLPNAPVVQLQVFNEGSTSVLRAATYGRGVWQIPLVTAGIVRTTAAAVPATLTFPSQQEQTESAQKTVTITNTGTITFNVTGVSILGADASDFTETDNCVQQAVTPGSTCSVQVVFAPSETGTRTATLAVFGNIPGGQVTAALSGNGVPGSAVVLTPDAMSFPTTLIGLKTVGQDITISNTGGVPATLTSETVTGDFAISANTCGNSIAPNFGCTLSITFAPTASGNRTGVLTVVGSAGTQTARLSGTGESPATDTLSPLTLSFSAQVVNTASSAQQVTLTNNGDQALQAITVKTTGDFSVANNCGGSLAGHSACAMNVEFLPTQIGTENGTLVVGDTLNQVVTGLATGVAHSQTVMLTGVGLPPAGVSATPSAINFGNYAVGGTSPAQAVTLTNNGGVTLTGLHFSVSGDFAIQPGPNACGATLAVDAACQIAINFSPSQAGGRTGSLVATASNLAAPLAVGLTGSGEDFTLQVMGSPSAVITSGQTATFQLQIAPVNGSTGTVNLACTGAPANATCTLNPASTTLTGTGTSFATVTVVTGASGSASSQTVFPGRLKKLGLALAMLAPLGLVSRRRRWRNLALLAVLAFLLPVGCSLGVTTNKTPPGSSSSGGGVTTPSGIYPLTVTGTAPGLSHSVSLTLTVE